MLRELITVNPRTIKHNSRPRKSSGAKKKYRATFRRNPRLLPSLMDIGESVVPAAIGAVGALGVSLAIGNIPVIPVEWRTGPRGLLVRGVAAFALGMVARSFLPAKLKKFADQATAGALTVSAYEGARSLITSQFPQLTLGLYDGDLSAYEAVNWGALPALNSGGMSAYVPAGAGSDLGMIPAVR